MLRLILFLLAIGLYGCSGNQEHRKLKVIGSDTEVNLVLELAEAYMDAHPDASIAVTGGGSGAGIAALINGRTDFANSSRPITNQELLLAQDAGVTPIPFVFACDAIVFIVHESHPVDSLTLEQIRDMYSGKTSNWEQVSNGSGMISLYGRQTNSGTYVYLRDILLKAEYSSSMKCMNGNAQIVESVRHDNNSIGFVSAGYVFDADWKSLPGIKVLKIVAHPGQAASDPADRSQLLSGKYPLTRPLFHYSNGQPVGLGLDFLHFETGESGESIVVRNGYLPVLPPFDTINLHYLP